MTHSIVLGGGCFWCLDAAYRMVKGVTDVVVGYAGGETKDPIYEEVASGTTGHAEVVKVTYDDDVISSDDIMSIFWTIHDPTTLNRQGHDIGTQYRSCILYQDENQRKLAEESIEKVAELWDDPIVTEVKPLGTFYPAEEYHQDYFSKNPEAGYCQVVINPKLVKLRKEAATLLKQP